MSDVELGSMTSKTKDDDDKTLTKSTCGKNKVQEAGGWKSAVKKQLDRKDPILKRKEMWTWILDVAYSNQYVHSDVSKSCLLFL